MSVLGKRLNKLGFQLAEDKARPLHSERGSQYCSREYNQMAKQHGFTVSMTCKDNCWDNAPVESSGYLKTGLAKREIFSYSR